MMMRGDCCLRVGGFLPLCRVCARWLGETFPRHAFLHVISLSHVLRSAKKLETRAANMFDVGTSPCDLARAVSAASMTYTKPSEEQVEDLLLSCRYGDLDEVKAFVEQFGTEPVQQARDDRGNNVLHMCCGNGHDGE